MNRPPEVLEEALRGRGVSPAWAKRLVIELRDHLECATREYVADGYPQDDAARLAHERLGHDDLIIERMLADAGSLTLPHRHPFLSFFAAPLVAVALALGLYVSIARGAGRVAIDVFGLEVTDWSFHALARMAYFSAGYLVWVVGAIGFCAVARRYRCAIRWPLLACLTLAGMAGLCYVNMTLPVGDTGVDIVTYGVDLTSRIPRIVLPLIIFVTFVGYEKRTKRLAG